MSETHAGLDRLAKQAGQAPKPKAAAKINLLREMLAPVGEDLSGLRDRPCCRASPAPSGARSYWDPRRAPGAE